MSHISRNGKKDAWSFEDPSTFTGSPEEVLQKIWNVRDEIERAVLSFIREASSVS
jgi:hypothetical protein